MSTTFTAIYEQGVLRPLSPLLLPERICVEVTIVQRPAQVQETTADRQGVYQALLDAGLVKVHMIAEPAPIISEADLLAAAAVLATAGPISDPAGDHLWPPTGHASASS